MAQLSMRTRETLHSLRYNWPVMLGVIVVLGAVLWGTAEMVRRDNNRIEEHFDRSRDDASAAYLRCRDAGGRPDPCEIEAIALIKSRYLDPEIASRSIRDLRAGREE